MKKEQIVRYILLALSIVLIGAGVVFLIINIAAGAIICLTFGVVVLFFAFVPYLWFKKVWLKTPTPSNDIKAVIFDMDGTLIDSTSLWHDIDINFFKKRGMDLPKDYAQKIVHLGLKGAAKFTKEEYGLKESEQEIMDEWHQMSLDMYRNDVKLKQGAIELLLFFKKKNIPMAIATANDDELYMPCIERLGIGSYFSYIADVNNIKEGKHSARIYEYLAEKMGVSKENTLVIEDMPTCIKTAYSSGFITVAMDDNASKEFEDEKRSNSDLFVHNFNELLDFLK